jgi:hypothetical protein
MATIKEQIKRLEAESEAQSKRIEDYEASLRADLEKKYGKSTRKPRKDKKGKKWGIDPGEDLKGIYEHIVERWDKFTGNVDELDVLLLGGTTTALFLRLNQAEYNKWKEIRDQYDSKAVRAMYESMLKAMPWVKGDKTETEWINERMEAYKTTMEERIKVSNKAMKDATITNLSIAIALTTMLRETRGNQVAQPVICAAIASILVFGDWWGNLKDITLEEVVNSPLGYGVGYIGGGIPGFAAVTTYKWFNKSKEEGGLGGWEGVWDKVTGWNK